MSRTKLTRKLCRKEGGIGLLETYLISPRLYNAKSILESIQGREI